MRKEKLLIKRRGTSIRPKESPPLPYLARTRLKARRVSFWPNSREAMSCSLSPPGVAVSPQRCAAASCVVSHRPAGVPTTSWLYGRKMKLKAKLESKS